VWDDQDGPSHLLLIEKRLSIGAGDAGSTYGDLRPTECRRPFLKSEIDLHSLQFGLIGRLLARITNAEKR
jgi:hypothetical protein